MKKTFIKPSARKYEINTRENIVSSIRFDDGSFSVQFHTIHTNPANIEEIWTETQGCFSILNNSFDIPTGPYVTQNYINNFIINNVMDNYDSFNDWYTDMKQTYPAIVGCHD